MKKEFLPQGDYIRQLLIKSNVSNSNINQLLREKGIFLGHIEKNNSVPLLMKSIISPRDYEILYNIQKTKEEAIKYRTSSIKCSSDFDFTNLLDDNFDLNKLINERHTYKPNYKIIGIPSFYFENENKAVLEYNIERENILNDWTNNKTYHSGAIILNKISGPDIQISIQQNSTSKETLEVNNILMNILKEKMQQKSIITSNEDIITVKFKHFDNTSRVKFFYSFFSDFDIYLKFDSITDIDLYLDENIVSHEDVKIFLDEIDNLKLNGKGLQNHILLREEKYFPKLILGSIKLKYKINYKSIEAGAVIDLGFPDYVKNKDENSEFQISIDLILNKQDRKSIIETEIRKKLLELFEIKKVNSYERFKIV